jgi:2-oxoglutarate ferredoxin oxidoreductase subunit delta
LVVGGIILPKGKVYFDIEKCKGCMLCVDVCPKKILVLDKVSINKKGYNLIKVIDPGNCIGCAFCAIMCPDSVITVEKIKE